MKKELEKEKSLEEKKLRERLEKSPLKLFLSNGSEIHFKKFDDNNDLKGLTPIEETLI